jgi:hypothetical protein
MITIGRVSTGILENASAERYLLVAALPIIALTHLSAIFLRRTSWFVGIMLALFALLLALQQEGRLRMIGQYRQLLAIKACAEIPSLADDSCFGAIVPAQHFPRLSVVMERMGFLKRLQVPSDAKRVTEAEAGSFDALSAYPLPYGGSGTVANGWTALEGCKIPDRVFLMTASGRTIGHARTGYLRDDVIPARGRCARFAGWEAVIRPDLLQSSKGQPLHAWAYDQSANILYRLRGDHVIR